MPRCLKDRNSSYTGREPSPKGMGFCAHCEQLGTEMRGRDGRPWVVVQDAVGRLSWRCRQKRKASPKATARKRRSPKATARKRRSPKATARKRRSPKATGRKRRSPKATGRKRRSPKATGRP